MPTITRRSGTHDPSDTASDAQLPRFGEFAITETATFPPSPTPQCWAYLTINAEVVLSLPQRPALQALLQSPRGRVSVDGQWIWWALRRKYPQRPLKKLSGSDLIYRIASHCADHGQRLLLLGATPRSNAGAVQALRKLNPGLDVHGYAPPLFAAEDESEQKMQEASLLVINAYRPHYVVLGLDNVKQHRFAWQTLTQLDGIVQGLLCFGGAIDMASGRVRRAPRLWQHLGLESIYRVLQEPSRLRRWFCSLRLLPILLSGRY